MAGEEKTISIKETELKELLDSNREMAKNVKSLSDRVNELSGIAEPERATLLRKSVSDTKVRVTFLNGKPIVGFNNRGTENKPVYIYEKPDPNDPKNRILYADVMLEGAEKPMTVQYIELMQEGEHVECLVKKTSVKEWAEEQGHVEAQEIKGDSYSPNKKGYDVPVGAVHKDITYTIELPDERLIDIDAEYVNIA